MGLLDKLTGKDVHQKVDEFAEVYGTVLLGIDNEMVAQQEAVTSGMKKIAEQQITLNSGLNEMRMGLEDIERYRGYIKKYYGELTDTLAKVDKSQAETGKFMVDVASNIEAMTNRVNELEGNILRQQTKLRNHKVAICILMLAVIMLTVMWVMK